MGNSFWLSGFFRKFSVIVITSGVFSNSLRCSNSLSYRCASDCIFVWYNESVFVGMCRLSNVVFRIGCVVFLRYAACVFVIVGVFKA